ncbi:TonB-dependent receptor [Mucilaginibacter sp. SP1R1]|uniref:TonB-dependent receptor n=1 Tax=Mucilaginibacter sp. SP1R1 TaxID=2723091 RepID=UPI00160B573E|nr:TonB-dependent receptor [Mucilaginibacter sp. SP1R1]MBB6151769.1 TonB-linked SusC/RagA family outer membrane protein [Mucilaginibacter sp. SP1R1]
MKLNHKATPVVWPDCTSIILTMKLTAIFLIAAFVQVSAKSFSQQVTIRQKNISIEKVLQLIEDQSSYHFLFKINDLSSSRNVNLELTNVSVEQALDQCFKNTAFTYKIINRTILVKKATDLLDPNANNNLVLQKVQGVVTDEKGIPLPGVTIKLKGTTTGTVTDVNGKFTLEIPDANSTLVISFVGFNSQEVLTNGRDVLSIHLKEAPKDLNEVVVVGYGTEKKVNLTGAVNTVNMEDLGSRPITSSSAALEGQVPGVYALQASGKAGGDGAVINIRGVGTLNNSDPLVLIDGLPGNMDDVNPADIQSFSVLKDAASAAIYGSRAANGVIIVTTKRGSNKKMKLSYDTYWGVQDPTALPKTMNSVQYATLYNEAAINTGMQAKYTADQIEKYGNGSDILYPNTNYLKVFYNKANMQNHHLNLSGGSDNLNYAFMLGYLDQDGILVGNNYNRYTFRSNLDAYFLKDNRLKLSANIFGSKGTTQSSTNEWQAKWYANNAPIWPLKNAAGDYVAVNGENNYYGEIMAGSLSTNLKNQVNTIFGANYTIVNGLTAELSYGYSWTQNHTKSFNPNFTTAKLGGGYNVNVANLTDFNSQDTQTQLTALLRYVKTFGKHSLNALAGYSQEEFDSNSVSAYRSGFVNNTQQEIALGDASTQTNNSSANALGLESFFGRLGYSYADKYLFEANIRRDGSSRFAKGNQWGAFPSFSAGWRLGQEDFMKGISWLSNLKIRGSWGKLGNQNINSRYASSQVLSSGQNYSLGGTLAPGVAMTSLANVNTTWETTTQTNIGVDASLFNNFTITADYFWKYTDNILLQVPIPITMGAYAPPFQNVGKVKNQGIEFMASYKKVFDNQMKLNVTMNISHITNKVTDLYGTSPIINGVKALVEGSPVNAFYGYKVAGLYQVSDFTWQNNSDPSVAPGSRQYVLKPGVVSVDNYSAVPGDLKFADLNGDGKVSMDKDRTIIGKQFPDIAYSAQMNLAWKGFDFTLFLQGVQGINGYQSLEIFEEFSGFSNTGIWWLNRWTPDHTNTNIPRLTLDDARRTIASSYYMENASYLRVKSIELGYTLPAKLLQRMKISNFRIYGNVQNAFTFTKFKGYDPEQTIDQTRAESYPQTRIFTIGANVSF